MNVKRFSARSSRDALILVREAFGEDAVVLSTRPCADGVEVLAMAPEAVACCRHLVRHGAGRGCNCCGAERRQQRALAARAAPAGGALGAWT